MKGENLKLLFLSAFIAMNALPAFSQDRNVSNTNTSEDSITCGKHLSAYRTFFKLDLYQYAHEKWLQAFDDCPSSSEMMYLDGVTMYRSYIKDAPEGPVREGLIDTLLLIYDRRMENFGGEGNVLGRKARDLLTYRGAEIEQVQNAYQMLKRSMELEGKESQDAVMLLLISTGITLNQDGMMDKNQIIDDYFLVNGFLDQIEGRSSRRDRTRSNIDELMLQEDVLSCEALDLYYEPKYEQNKNDLSFLKKLVHVYTISVCNRSDIFAVASENLYSLEPSPESAHNLAIIFFTRKDYNKAEDFLKEAVQGDNIDQVSRAEWYYELATIKSNTEEYCEAIEHAREAIKLNGNLGKAYILLGDAFIASRNKLGDDFLQRTAFWAASDKYDKAASVDPSLASEARQKLNDILGQYPSNEEIFFRDIKEGDSYLVGGCINEQATVRSRK